MTRPTLACCAYNFGYGPAAKLLYVARRLADAGKPRLIFIGSGISHELCSRSDLFDDVVRAEPGDEAADRVLRSSHALLSLMERDLSALALERGIHLYVADSLTWMRRHFPPTCFRARRYWAQRFVGVEERLGDIGPHARPVGPIVGASPKIVENHARGSGGLVINLGGCESPQGGARDDPAYADFVLTALHALNTEATLLTGERCAEYLRPRVPRGVTVRSAPHEEAQALLHSARRVLTAPGLTATYECFHAGVPTHFLPPENYSQWWILKHLRARGLADGAFHWEDLWPENPIVERMAEEKRTPLVAGAIRRIGADGRAVERFVSQTRAALAGEGDGLMHRQRDFFDSLGPNGAQTIAEQITRDLCDLECGISMPLSPPRLDAAVPLPVRFTAGQKTDWPHAPQHWTLDPGLYMVTAGTYRKAHHLNSDARLDLMLSSLFSVAQEYGWSLRAWAILSNHYHFIAQSPGDPSSLKRMISKLHTTTARRFNREDGKPGRKVWHQYWDSRITFQNSYLARLRYVHTNPVRHGVAARAENYPWCSAAWFAMHAPRSFVETVQSFKTDGVNVRDDY